MGGFVVELAPQVREAIVVEFNDMEVVEEWTALGNLQKIKKPPEGAKSFVRLNS
jgi:hypothetical protein